MTEKLLAACLVSILVAGFGRTPPTEEIGEHLFGQPAEGTDRLILTAKTGSVTLKPSRQGKRIKFSRPRAQSGPLERAACPA
jgi:hypothetical protein